jgi:hypothetical protein
LKVLVPLWLAFIVGGLLGAAVFILIEQWSLLIPSTTIGIAGIIAVIWRHNLQRRKMVFGLGKDSVPTSPDKPEKSQLLRRKDDLASFQDVSPGEPRNEDSRTINLEDISASSSPLEVVLRSPGKEFTPATLRKSTAAGSSIRASHSFRKSNSGLPEPQQLVTPEESVHSVGIQLPEPENSSTLPKEPLGDSPLESRSEPYLSNETVTPLRHSLSLTNLPSAELLSNPSVVVPNTDFSHNPFLNPHLTQDERPPTPKLSPPPTAIRRNNTPKLDL